MDERECDGQVTRPRQVESHVTSDSSTTNLSRIRSKGFKFIHSTPFRSDDKRFKKLLQTPSHACRSPSTTDRPGAGSAGRPLPLLAEKGEKKDEQDEGEKVVDVEELKNPTCSIACNLRFPRHPLSLRVEDVAVTHEFSKVIIDASHDSTLATRIPGPIVAKHYARSTSTSPLRYAQEARSLLAFSKLHNQPALRRAAELHHLTAVRIIQRLLKRPSLSNFNELMLAIWTLAAWEVTANGSSGLSTFQCHILGIKSLLQLPISKELDDDDDFTEIYHALTNQFTVTCIRAATRLPRFLDGDIDRWVIKSMRSNRPLDELSRIAAEVAELRARLKALPKLDDVNCLGLIEDAQSVNHILDEWFYARPIEWQPIMSSMPHDWISTPSAEVRQRLTWPYYYHNFQDRHIANSMSFYYYLRLELAALICRCSNTTDSGSSHYPDLAAFNASSQLDLRRWVDDVCSNTVTLSEDSDRFTFNWTFMCLKFAIRLESTPLHQKWWISHCYDAAPDDLGHKDSYMQLLTRSDDLLITGSLETCD